jgi:signal transduction histidine kinase/ligand-binding sensor domain-containing protein
VPERTTFKLSWCWLLLVAGLFLDELGNALPVDRSLGELQHLTWGVRDGAPADIWAITQSADGFLLLGTGSGLYRFDGVSFEHITNANDPAVTFRDITALMALPSGELWIGYYAGGASLLSNGHITTFGVNDGVPQGWVTAFATEENGTVWLSALQGLARFSGGRWERIGAAWNFASAGAHWVLIDGRGTLWVAGGDKVAFLRRGSRQFEDSGVKGDFKSTLAMAPDGTVWLASESFGPRPLRLPEDVARPVAVGASWDLPPAKRLMFDREGTMWATDAVRGGVYRFALPKPDIKTRNVSPRETFTEGDGLASDIAVPLFEDREGNIWVGTNLGLNVFRATNFVKETRIPITKTGYAISADREDGVWIGAGKLIYRAKEKRVDLAAKSDSPIRSAFRSPDGTIWFGTNNGLIKIKDGIAKTILLPNDDHTARYEYVNSISAAEDGNLNVSIVGRGLGRFDGSTWLIPNDQGNPTNKSPVALWTDNLKRLWSGYSDGTVKAAEGDAQRTYGKEEGLTIGPITAIGGDGPLILAAGEWGIARFNGRRFESLDASRSEAFSGVTGIVATPNHDVWLNGHQGVVRLSPEQLRNYIDRPEKRPQPELFDLLDGLPGIAQQGVDHTAAVSTDGRLWFSTNHGVAWIDPLHLLKNNLSPRVVIRSFEADEKNLAPTEPVELPQLTRTIRIGFTALSLTAPQRIRFRYMLEGADDTWREGGNERRVVYANLRPGRYVFRVIASNNDGVWNDTGAALSFNLPPTFYQTKWFLGLCIAVAVLLMAALFVLRVRQIKHRLRARLEQRIEDKIGERTRIARELHDSLLQSFLGLMFRLQAVRELLPVQPGNAAQVLDRAMERGDEAINEGREALADLRDSRNAVDLVESLKILGRQLESESSTGRPPRFRVLIEGRTRPLNPLVRDEIYRVAREALRNAYRHAKARAIEAELYYGASQFRLRVRDDGIGIEPQVLNQGGRHGHWGLPGMRERANSMGGELQFWSESMRGTKIELCLSAKIAYVNYVMSLLPRTREATRP